MSSQKAFSDVHVKVGEEEGAIGQVFKGKRALKRKVRLRRRKFDFPFPFVSFMAAYQDRAQGFGCKAVQIKILSVQRGLVGPFTVKSFAPQGSFQRDLSEIIE